MTAWLQTMGWMLVCSLVFMGVGVLAQRLLRVRANGHPWRSFWWGFVASMPLASLWNLFAPLDERAALAFAMLGASGLVLERKKLLLHARGLTKQRRAAVGLWLAAWAALPWVSLQPLECIDAGFYYVASIEWHRAYAAVPGLQATNPLSVFNTGAFLLMTLTSTGPFAHEGHLVFNAMLAWWGLPVLADAVQTLTRRWSLPALAMSLAVLPALDSLPTNRMSCPSADLGLLWLGLAAVSLTLHARRRPGAMPVFLLLLPMFKLSMLSLTVTLLLLCRTSRVVKPALVVALAWAPFLITNVVVSGYPLYPAPVLRLGFDWALPSGLVQQVNAIISGYSRHDGIVGHDDPLMPVLRLLLMNRAVSMPAMLFAGGALVALVRAVRSKWPLRAWAPLAACLAGVALWFMLAPDARFAGVLLWLSGAVAVATALGLTVKASLAPDLASRVGLLLALFALLAGDVPFTTLPPLPTGRPVLPDNRADARMTLEDGTQVLDCTPGRLDGKGPGCFSIPCASLFPPGLRLRVPGDVSKGFTLPESALLPPELVY